MVNEIGSFIVNIKAQIDGYQDQIKRIKTELEKIGENTDIGKKIARSLKNAESQIARLGRTAEKRISSESQLISLRDSLQSINNLILGIGESFSQVSWDDLKTDELRNKIQEINTEITNLSAQMQENFSSGIKQALSTSEELRNVFKDLKIDPSKMSAEQIAGKLSQELDKSKNAVTELQTQFDEVTMKADAAAKKVESIGANLTNAKQAKTELIDIFDILQTISEQKVDNTQIFTFTAELEDKLQELDSSVDTAGRDIVGKIREIWIDMYGETNPEKIEANLYEINRLFKELNGSSLSSNLVGFGNRIDKIFQKLAPTEVKQSATALESFKNSLSELFAKNNNFNMEESEAKKFIENLIDINGTEESIKKAKQKVSFLIADYQKSLNESYRREQSNVTSLGKKKDSVADSLANAQNRNNLLEVATEKFKVEIAKVQKENEQLKTRLTEVEKRLKELTQEKNLRNEKNGAPLGSVGTDIKKEGAENINKVNQAMTVYSSKLDEVKAKEQLVGNIQSFAQRWFSVYAAARMVSEAFRTLKNDLKELDNVMTEIAIVTNKTQEDLWSQMPQYSAMAKEYASSLKGVYEVFQLYYQQGLGQNDVMALTEQTLKMAKISGLEYATATDYMTNAVRSFKMEMTEAQRVVDVYSELAASSATNTAELATAMSKTASSAQAVGSSFENTSAMMAVMIESTRESAENIGSAMKSIISRYGEMKEDPSKLVDSEGQEMSFNKVDKALQSVGISIQDVNHQFKDFDDVIFELASKWDTIDKNTQRYIATVMAGNRQQSRFLALVSNGEHLIELSEEAANSEDAATLQVLKTMDSISAKAQQLQTSLQDLYTQSGLEEVYKWILDVGKNIIDSFNSMPKIFGNFAIPALATFTQLFLNIGSLITQGIAKWKEKFTTMRSNLEENISEGAQSGIQNSQQHANSLVNMFKTAAQQIKQHLSAAISEGTNSKTLTSPSPITGGVTNINREYKQFSKEELARLSKENNGAYEIAKSYNRMVRDGKMEGAQYKADLLRNRHGVFTPGSGAEYGPVPAGNKNNQESTAEHTDSLEQQIGWWDKYRSTVSSASRAIGAGLQIVSMAMDKSTKSGEKLAASLNLAGGVMSAFGYAAMGNWPMAIVSGLTTAIKAVDDFTETTKEKIDRLEKDITDTNNAKLKSKDELKTLIDYKAKYDELAKIRNKDAESRKEWIKLNNEIATNYPELLKYMDTEGNSIANMGKAYDELLAKKQEVYKEDFNNQIKAEAAAYSDLAYFANERTGFASNINTNIGINKTLDLVKGVFSQSEYAQTELGESWNYFNKHFNEYNDSLDSLAILIGKAALSMYNGSLNYDYTEMQLSDYTKQLKDAFVNEDWEAAHELVNTMHQSATVFGKAVDEEDARVLENVYIDIAKNLPEYTTRLSDYFTKIMSEYVSSILYSENPDLNLNSNLVGKNLSDNLNNKWQEILSQTISSMSIEELADSEKSAAIINKAWLNFQNESSSLAAQYIDSFIEEHPNYKRDSNFATAESIFDDFNQYSLEYLTNLSDDVKSYLGDENYQDVIEEAQKTVKTLKAGMAELLSEGIENEDIEYSQEVEDLAADFADIFQKIPLDLGDKYLNIVSNTLKSGNLTSSGKIGALKALLAKRNEVLNSKIFDENQIAQIEQIFANADITNLSGIYELQKALSDLNIVVDFSDISNQVIPNFVTEYSSLKTKVQENLSDLNKAISSATKGMDTDTALKMANKLGISLDDFRIVSGKYYYDNISKILEVYEGVDNDLVSLIGKSFEETEGLLGSLKAKEEKILETPVFSSFKGPVYSESKGQAVTFDALEESEQLAYIQNMLPEGLTIEQAQEVLNYYNQYYADFLEKADEYNNNFWDYVIEQVGVEKVNLESILGVEKYNANVSLLNNGRFKEFLNEMGQGAFTESLMEDFLNENISALLQFFPEYASAIINSVNGYRNGLYEDIIKSIQNEGFIVSTVENDDFFKQFVEGEDAILEQVGENTYQFIGDNYQALINKVKKDTALTNDERNNLLKSIYAEQYEYNIYDSLSNIVDTFDSFSYDTAQAFARSIHTTVEDLITSEVFKIDSTGNISTSYEELIKQLNNALFSKLIDNKQYAELRGKLEQQKIDLDHDNIIRSIITKRDKISTEAIGQLADAMGITYSQVIQDLSLQQNDDGTYRLNIVNLWNNFQNQMNDTLRDYVASEIDSVISSMTGLAGSQSKGYTDLASMQAYIKSLNQMNIINRKTGEAFTFNELFEYNDSLRAYQLSTEGIIAQIYGLQNQINFISDEQFAAKQKLMQETKHQFADLIDADSLIAAIGTNEYENIKTSFIKTVEDYNAVLQAMAAPLETIYDFNAEKLISDFEQGGIQAIEAMRQIAEAQGKQMTAEQAEAAWRSEVGRYVNAIDTLIAKPGEIVNSTTAEIINEANGFATELGNSGTYLVQTAADLYKAYKYLLDKMVATGEATLVDLNNVAALALENRDGEQQIIDALGDAAGMTFTRFGEILADAGIQLTEDMINQLETAGIINLMGGNKMRIVDFNAFANLMNWNPDSEEYVSAFKSYNDSLIEINHQAERNILEEAKNVASAQGGDWINLTQLANVLNKQIVDSIFDVNDSGEKIKIDISTLDKLNSIIFKYGAQIEDGILKLDDSANIPTIMQEIAKAAAESGSLLSSELAELADAVADAIKGYADLINNAISGSLSNVQAEQLQDWATTNGIGKLNFTETADGLKVATDQAFELVAALRQVDSMQGKLTFDKLVDSLSADKGGRFENISKTTAEIAKLEREIQKNELTISQYRQDGESLNKEGIQNLQKKNSELREQISLYREIQQAQSIDPSQYNFMDRDIPEVMQGPINYWNSVGKAYSALNETAQTGKMDIQDFTNIVNEMSNLAATSGEKLMFFGREIDGSATTAAELIQEGYTALSNVDGKGVQVDLSKMGIDFAAGADNAKNNFDKGIQSLADAQISMLDAAIQVLEVVVAMEKLGDIDVDNNNVFSIGDIFKLDENGNATNEYTKQYQNFAADLIKQTETNEELKEALESVKVNNISLKQMFEDAANGVKALNISEEAYFSVMEAFVKAAQNGDYNLDTIQDSVWNIINNSFPDGTTIDVGDRTFIISGGSVAQIDWQDPKTEEALKQVEKQLGEDKDKARETLTDYFTKFETGEGNLELEETLIVLHAKGKLKVKFDEDGNPEFIEDSQGNEFDPKSATGQELIAKSVLEAKGLTEDDIFPADIEYDDKGAPIVTITARTKIGEATILVEADGNGKVVYKYGNLTASSLEELKEQMIQQYLENNPTTEDGTTTTRFQAKKILFGMDVEPEVKINTEGTNSPKVQKQALEVANKTTEELETLINNGIDDGYSKGKVSESGYIPYTINGIEIEVEDTGDEVQNIAAAQEKITSLVESLQLANTITEAIKNAFTAEDNPIGKAIGDGISSAFAATATEGQEIPIPEMNAVVTTAKITGITSYDTSALEGTNITDIAISSSEGTVTTLNITNVTNANLAEGTVITPVSLTKVDGNPSSFIIQLGSATTSYEGISKEGYTIPNNMLPLVNAILTAFSIDASGVTRPEYTGLLNQYSIPSENIPKVIALLNSLGFYAGGVTPEYEGIKDSYTIPQEKIPTINGFLSQLGLTVLSTAEAEFNGAGLMKTYTISDVKLNANGEVGHLTIKVGEPNANGERSYGIDWIGDFGTPEYNENGGIEGEAVVKAIKYKYEPDPENKNQGTTTTEVTTILGYTPPSSIIAANNVTATAEVSEVTFVYKKNNENGEDQLEEIRTNITDKDGNPIIIPVTVDVNAEQIKTDIRNALVDAGFTQGEATELTDIIYTAYADVIPQLKSDDADYTSAITALKEQGIDLTVAAVAGDVANEVNQIIEEQEKKKIELSVKAKESPFSDSGKKVRDEITQARFDPNKEFDIEHPEEMLYYISDLKALTDTGESLSDIDFSNLEYIQSLISESNSEGLNQLSGIIAQIMGVSEENQNSNLQQLIKLAESFSGLEIGNLPEIATALENIATQAQTLEGIAWDKIAEGITKVTEAQTGDKKTGNEGGTPETGSGGGESGGGLIDTSTLAGAIGEIQGTVDNLTGVFNAAKEAINQVASDVNSIDVSHASGAKEALNKIVPAKALAAKTALNNIQPSHAKEAKEAINEIKGSDISLGVEINVSVEGPNGAKGTLQSASSSNGSITRSGMSAHWKNKAYAAGRDTLMGELGPELVVSNGRYFVVGQNGPEMVNLASDAIVFNHLQTKKLIEKGKVNSRGTPITNERAAVSFATGNFEGTAMASASEALAALKELRAMWESLKNASLKDLGAMPSGTGGGGGGGGGDSEAIKSILKDVEKWYNILQDIERTEKNINDLSKEYILLEKQKISSAEKLKNLNAQYEQHLHNVKNREELINEAIKERNRIVANVNGSGEISAFKALGAFYGFDNQGNMFLKNDKDFLNYAGDYLTADQKALLMSGGTVTKEISRAYNMGDAEAEYQKWLETHENVSDKKKENKRKKIEEKYQKKIDKGSRTKETYEIPTTGLELMNELQRTQNGVALYDAKAQVQILKAAGMGELIKYSKDGSQIASDDYEGLVENFYDLVDGIKEEYENNTNIIDEQTQAVLEDKIAMQEYNEQIREIYKPVVGITEELEKWYNITRNITLLQTKDNLLAKQSELLEADMVANGAEIYDLYKKRLAVKEQELAKTKELSQEQKKQLELDRSKIENSALSKFISFDENGSAVYNKNAIGGQIGYMGVGKLLTNAAGYNYDNEGRYVDMNGILRDANGQEITDKNIQIGQLQTGIGETKFFDATGLNLEQIVKELSEQSLNGEYKYDARETYQILRQLGFEDLMKYDSSGEQIYEDFGEMSDEAKQKAINEALKRIISNVEDYNKDQDDYLKTQESELSIQKEILDAQNGMRDKYIDFQNTLRDAIVAERQNAIDTQTEIKDAIKDTSDKTLEGLKESLEQEKKIFESGKDEEELATLQTQLGVLQRSGGSLSKIRELQDKIKDKQQQMYFTERENAIDDLEDASKRQIEALETQIDIQTSILENQQKFGLLWGQVNEMLATWSPEQIGEYVTKWNKDALSLNSTELTEITKANVEAAQTITSYFDDLQIPVKADIKVTVDNKANDTNVEVEGQEGKTNEGGEDSGGNEPIEPSTSIINETEIPYEEPIQPTPEANISEETGFPVEILKGWKYFTKEKNSYDSKNDAKIAKVFEKKHNGTILGISREPIFNNIDGQPRYMMKVGGAKGQIWYVPMAYSYFGKEFIDNLLNNHNFPRFASGGTIDYTGPAWVDGTKSRPEQIFNFEQMEKLRAHLLTNVDITRSAVNGLASIIENLPNANTYNNINNDSGVTIERFEMHMEVKEIGSDYDARRAGQTAFEEMVRIARKAGNRSVSRR